MWTLLDGTCITTGPPFTIELFASGLPTTQPALMLTLERKLCPLCGGLTHELIESISCKQLTRLYGELGVDIAFDRHRIDFMKCLSCGLHFFFPLVPGDEKFYESLQRFDWYYMPDKPEYHLAARWISDGAWVLEIGSGAGHFAKFCPQARYRGLEFNEPAIEKARLAGITVMKQSIEDHCLQHPGAYDVVVSFQVLEHVHSPYSFLQAASRCVAPGGLLVVAVPSESSFVRIAPNNVLNCPPHHVTRWTDVALKNVSAIVGLELQDLVHEPVAAFHTGWFRYVKWYQWLCQKSGHSPKLLETSLSGRLLMRAASLASRITEPPANAENWGHTVLAAYRVSNQRV